MCGKKPHGANVCGNMVQHRLCDCNTVPGAGASAELVKDDERAGSGFREDFLGLRKLDKEGGLRGKDFVVGAET